MTNQQHIAMLTKQQEIAMLADFIASLPDGYLRDYLQGTVDQFTRMITTDILIPHDEHMAWAEGELEATRKATREAEKKINALRDEEKEKRRQIDKLDGVIKDMKTGVERVLRAFA